MEDLTRPWPLGLGTRLWWRPVAGALLLFLLALAVDRPLSTWAQTWAQPIKEVFAQITPYGEAEWVLYPSIALLVLTAGVALVTRWRLMRTMLWQLAAVYGFFVAGFGLPWVVTNLIKGVVGRARPSDLTDVVQILFQPSWGDWARQSFPSGHATNAFALFMVIGFLAPRWLYPGLVVAAAIAVSRITLGFHYPSDVTAGAIVGTLGAYTARWIFARRGWAFRRLGDGRIVARPLSSLKRYIALRQRGSGRGQQPGRP
jgi:undecaprenyl-diphosphatase